MRAWRDGDGGHDALGAAVEAARSGDEAAFRAVYTQVHPGLLRYVRVLVSDEAEDVTSEAWLQVVRDLHKFRGDGADFRAWAATIARHRALDHVRHARRRPAYPTPVEELPEPRTAPDAADLALDTLSTAEAVALVASLPVDQAEAVMLRAVLGLDAVAAAKVLGKRPGAVRMAAHRGLHRLAERLGATEDRPRHARGRDE
ncbi:RNA polymerase sigma factor [Hamadaea tsunoensis]|uniref:RNA polymerase sigma factor n=1 Tax=Hamadaea tsunoensis TaxID=53368 RepID=UPI00040578F7|nr:RNA polymerase sigma factor [Hamadaea tsunoensis]